MFVHEKKSWFDFNRRHFQKNQISVIPKVGMDLILQKAAFQSSHIFMHAVHIILSTIFTSLQTLYSNDK